MNILMFGWEFPPHVSGGLGTACFGITKAITDLGHRVIFILPKLADGDVRSHVELVSAAHIAAHSLQDADSVAAAYYHIEEAERLSTISIQSLLHPYLNESQYKELINRDSSRASDSAFNKAESPVNREFRSWFFETSGDYGSDLLAEVSRYGEAAGFVASRYDFDVIHAHDWMTVYAGITAKKFSGKPLVLHIHALEYDRSGENVNPKILEIERYGMNMADRIVAVSNYTRQRIIDLYGIDSSRINVIHNAVSHLDAGKIYHVKSKQDRRVVLFLGRITFQKGPDYFIEAAAKVLKAMPNIEFVMAGTGDMMARMVERVAELGLGRHFHFTGFLRGDDVERMYASSDLYVMPSVSEPFGIAPLEAMLYDVPVIISHQSGVAEILKYALKVNFWDVDEIANKIIGVLKYPVLFNDIVERSKEQLKNIRWETAADKIVRLYQDIM